MKYEVVYSQNKKRKEWMDGELLCSKAEQSASLYKTNLNAPSKHGKRQRQRLRQRKIAEARITNLNLQPDEEIQIQNYLVIIQASLHEHDHQHQHPPKPPTSPKSAPKIHQNVSPLPPSKTNSPLSTDDLIALISRKVRNRHDRTKSDPNPDYANKTHTNSSIAVSVKALKPKRSLSATQAIEVEPKKDVFKVPKLTVKSNLGQLRLNPPSKEISDISRKREVRLDIKPSYELDEWKTWLKRAVLEEIQLGIDLTAGHTLQTKPHVAQMYRKSRRRKSNDSRPRGDIPPDSYFLYGPAFKDNQKDDIYYVCKSKDLNNPQKVWLFVSEWHGSADDAMQVRPLSTNFSKTQISSTWNSKSKVFVIRGPNVAHHLGMMQALETMTLKEPPITPSLLGLDSPNQEHDGLLLALKSLGVVQSTLDKWLLDLNEDQKKALRSMADWFTEKDVDPVTLVHGIFGSGKTRLLVTAVLFLLELLNTLGLSHVKICITSATNNAVDKILLALEDAGLTEMARIGSKKVHKRIKKYTATALQTTPPRVVGITCCASAFKDMRSLFAEENIHAITFIDECFQIPEALSMLSICYAGTSHMVLLGDPNQLPPVSNLNVAYPGKVTFSDSLYKRLQLMGKTPIVLRKQYRCHPDISRLASTLFYNNIVVNGVTKEDRLSLLANNHALVFKDTGRSREVKVRGSITNPDEQNVIVQLVRYMVKPEVGISASDIGVIALYRAQAFALQKRLEPFKVEASTVDAFQGQEKDIIIVSPCRNHASDFACDKQRLNVMLTRAKRHFILVGNVEGLRNNALWKHVIRAMSPLQSL